MGMPSNVSWYTSTYPSAGLNASIELLTVGDKIPVPSLGQLYRSVDAFSRKPISPSPIYKNMKEPTSHYNHDATNSRAHHYPSPPPHYLFAPRHSRHCISAVHLFLPHPHLQLGRTWKHLYLFTFPSFVSPSSHRSLHKIDCKTNKDDHTD